MDEKTKTEQLNALAAMPDLALPEARAAIDELAALYRRAVQAKDEHLASLTREAASLIGESESSAVKAMYLRDIGAVANEPITPVGLTDEAFRAGVAAGPGAAAMASFVAGEGTSAKALYLRDFIKAALPKKK